MARYKDITPTTADPATIYQMITDLLIGSRYSVEVIPDRPNKTVTLRVWYATAYDLADHENIGTPPAPVMRSAPGAKKVAKKAAKKVMKKTARRG